MLKICAHICMCGIKKDILFRGKNPFYNSLLEGLATLYWILVLNNPKVMDSTTEWLQHFFPFKDWERKDKCCTLIIDFCDFLVLEVVCRVKLRISYDSETETFSYSYMLTTFIPIILRMCKWRSCDLSYDPGRVKIAS